MIEGGEDPLYITRRVVRMAAEDIGLADPQALTITLAAKDTYHFLGSPEGELAIAQAVVYLATAPKSNRVYAAWGEALEAARQSPAAPVPLHIRNAPTGLMKELGYGKGYQYAHDFDDAYVPQEYLPEEMRGRAFYQPGELGFEKKIAERLAYWAQLRDEDREECTRVMTSHAIGATCEFIESYWHSGARRIAGCACPEHGQVPGADRRTAGPCIVRGIGLTGGTLDLQPGGHQSQQRGYQGNQAAAGAGCGGDPLWRRRAERRVQPAQGPADDCHRSADASTGPAWERRPAPR